VRQEIFHPLTEHVILSLQPCAPALNGYWSSLLEPVSRWQLIGWLISYFVVGLVILWASPVICTTMWWNAFGVVCMSSPVGYWHVVGSDMKFYFSITTRLCFPFYFVVFVTVL
jgi:hypothetical protein